MQVRIGIGRNSILASKNADELAVDIVNYVEKNRLDNVMVYKTEFYGYDDDKPCLELEVPNIGKIVFGRVEFKEAIEIINKYAFDVNHIKSFMINNDGNRKCNHH